MAMELKRLVEKVQNMDITLVAGEGGIAHPVTWVHMVENVAAAEFLTGGEILFVTGIGLHEDDGLTELVQHAYKKKAAGMVVNVGPYLETVPESTKQFADVHDFPIYVVPWEVHLAEIIRVFCFSITKADQKMMERIAAFKNAIFFPKQEELYVVPLSQRNFNVNWRYSAGVMHIETTKGNRLDRMEGLCVYLENYLRHTYENFVIFTNDQEIILVMANMEEGEQRSFIQIVMKKTNQYLIAGETMTIGVGRLTKSIRCLYKSYNQARSIQKLHANGKLDANTIFYTDLGIYRLLMGIEDMEIMREYYGCTLGRLEEYDNTKGTDFCDVLKCYLSHDGSVKDTADELFVHRNTINYKLNRIEEILDVELSSLSTRLELMIAFTLKDILH